MRNGTPVGAGSLLPSAAQVKPKSPKKVRSSKLPPAAATPPDPVSLPEVISNRLPGPNEWPRLFGVPGVTGAVLMHPRDVLSHLVPAVMGLEEELHALAVSLIPTKPVEAAAFAELLAICEELACSFGYATALDETPVGSRSSLGVLAAHSKAFALIKSYPAKRRGEQAE